MRTYREWIDGLKAKWIGKTVIYNNARYRVVDVDYNGFLLIDKKALYTETTAVKIYQVKEIQPDTFRHYKYGTAMICIRRIDGKPVRAEIFKGVYNGRNIFIFNMYYCYHFYMFIYQIYCSVKSVG